MNLIANTGIQFFVTPLEIDLKDNFKMYFHEWFDTNEQLLKLELAHKFLDNDGEIWVKKFDLAYLGYVQHGEISERWESIKQDFYSELKQPINIQTERPEDSGCFQESAGRISWEKFENVWLPFPYFQLTNGNSEFGPTNWCRFKLIPHETNNQYRKYNLLLVFDTRTQFEDEGFENEDLYETPVFSNNYQESKDFALCNDEFSLVDYCSKSKNCEWVDEYILKIFYNIDNISELRVQKPKLNYLAQYLFIIRYIQKLNILPAITLYSNRITPYGNVDLVIDIGNSRTCAVLYDNSDFDKTSPLELLDFTTPLLGSKLNKHTDSFDMRLAFRKADFGMKLGRIDSKQFIYPSLVRLGIEANQLIHKAINLNLGTEKTTTFSSPKRFLWDNKPQKKEWEFVKLEGEIQKPLYLKGISEQLNSDGSLNTEGSGGGLTYYSRKSLMTFAFLEILTQANRQINSVEQREYWGNIDAPRQIGRIIITCPPAMSKVEQIALRECAEEATIILNRFFENTYDKPIDLNDYKIRIQVIPSVKNLRNNEERTQWIYDETSCAQFTFLYAEIGKRYLKSVEEYFDLYGKIRNDLPEYNKKSLTIGSIDIGAGTTDVMIATYKYDNANQCTLTPIPLFWESFHKAGDDLLKELIHQLVIEGQYSPIENKLSELGRSYQEIGNLLNDFFGGDTGMSISYRQLRRDFNLQVSVPIVSCYLELLKENVENKTLTFNEIFQDYFPAQNILAHFKHHFGFDFKILTWDYDKKIISSLVEKTFDSLIGKISALFSYYSCDLVLLCGRPTSLKPLTDLFLKYYAVSPNRLKTMNNYRIGRWYPQDKRYPFVDGDGYFINPKSIITTGAMIGNFASERGALNGFSLNLDAMIKKMSPTTEYFGKLNEQTLEFTETIISPDINFQMIEISSLPLRIGCRQFDSPSYPSRPFYTLDFDIEKIEDSVKSQLMNENDANAIQREIEAKKSNILKQMPLKLSIRRDYNEDKELLYIESVSSREGNELNKNFFRLQVQSMSETDNFWLDSGIFLLNIRK